MDYRLTLSAILLLASLFTSVPSTESSNFNLCQLRSFLLNRNVLVRDDNHVEYHCKLPQGATLGYCRGGCAATFKYELHVDSTAFEATSKCTMHSKACIDTGSSVVDYVAQDCTFASDGTPATLSQAVRTVNFYQPIGCQCTWQYVSDTTASKCEDTWTID